MRAIVVGQGIIFGLVAFLKYQRRDSLDQSNYQDLRWLFANFPGLPKINGRVSFWKFAITIFAGSMFLGLARIVMVPPA